LYSFLQGVAKKPVAKAKVEVKSLQIAKAAARKEQMERERKLKLKMEREAKLKKVLENKKQMDLEKKQKSVLPTGKRAADEEVHEVLPKKKVAMARTLGSLGGQSGLDDKLKKPEKQVDLELIVEIAFTYCSIFENATTTRKYKEPNIAAKPST
jgi:hypothetical protein